jgi:hypothetical protein
MTISLVGGRPCFSRNSRRCFSAAASLVLSITEMRSGGARVSSSFFNRCAKWYVQIRRLGLLNLSRIFGTFCHLKLGGDVTEASTLGRFRNHLVEHDLWERLSEGDQPSASTSSPSSTLCNVYEKVCPSSRSRCFFVVAVMVLILKSTYGYSLHSVTNHSAGNVHANVECDTLLLGDETGLYADIDISNYDVTRVP